MFAIRLASKAVGGVTVPAVRAMTYAANQKYVNGRKVAAEAQPGPSDAMELIAKVPPVKVAGRRAACDGGGGALGHPRVFINLDADRPVECGYCGIRFVEDGHAH